MSDFEEQLTTELRENTAERHRLQARANMLQDNLRRLRCGEPELIVRARVEAEDLKSILRTA